mgnify:CR=1 FL=1|jgi:hypothetical protein
MRKSIFVLAAIFSFAIVLTSCKETKKEEVKEEVQMESHEGHDHSNEKMASNVYQCPMDCEQGKTYEEAGSCPVCKMDLKMKSMEMEHAEGCKCVETGDCKCEGGTCECKKEMAANAKECTKCEPGKCQCKA